MATYQPLDPKALAPDINPADRNNYALQAGYTGWSDYLDNANKQRQGGGGTNASIGSTGGMSGIGTMGAATGTPDLTAIYKQLYGESGIDKSQGELDALMAQMTMKQKAAADAAAKINDNPFYAEGTRVGRIAKLNEISNADQTVLTNQQKILADQIAMKKADVETQLNLKLKQFDINSSAATQALNQFNSLLESGALSNMSGEDIANLTRTTGLSSTMIQSAVNAQKQKNIKTSTISFDDGTNQGYAVINSDTGEIISKQVVAASKPTKTTGTGGSDLTPTQTRAVTAVARQAIIAVDTNGDEAVSIKEFQQAIQDIMSKSGVDQSVAEEQAAQALSDLDFKTWHWNT